MTTLKGDIYDVLTGDTTYITNMGSPAAAPYRTYYIKPPVRPVFPQVVYHVVSVSYGQEHGRALLYAMATVRFNIFSQDETYETIAARIIWLLHQTAQANGWRAILEGVTQELYDEEFDVYGKRLTFIVHYRSSNE